MRRRRRSQAALLVLLSATLATVVAATLVVEATLPATDATVRIAGLSHRVDVTYDTRGIPRIRAADAHDADIAIGFVHARDRMMQMDLMRRAASGRLSELVGASALRIDMAARVLGVAQAADAMLASSPPAVRRSLEAYATGVNAFIALRGRFASLGEVFLGPPIPWQPADSLLWAETMGLALSDNLRTELERLSLAPRMDRDRILDLWPVGPDPRRAFRSDRSGATGTAALAGGILSVLPRFPQAYTLPDTASNAWAVDGARSATGAPLLAGDPHLSYALPCLWYLARIDLPDQTLVGATGPGSPFLVLGRNRQIAWTFTTAGADTEDVFVERVLDRDHYLAPGGPLAFGHRRERIRVRFGPDRVIEIRTTRHGPVLSDLPALFGIAAPPPGEVLAASIAALLPGNRAPLGLLDLDRSADVAEAGRAAAEITAPVQNLVVADRSTIALFTTGRVPQRRSGDGATAVDGADGASDWTGFRSGTDLPHIVAPVDGLIVNANEPVPDAGTAPLARDTFEDWRARRIRQILDGPGAPNDVDGFARMQGDVRSLMVAALLPALASTRPADERSARALALLAGWDGTMSADAAAPLIVEAWIRALEREIARTMQDPSMLAMRPDALLVRALSQPVPSASTGALLARTLADATASLAAAHGDDPAKWRWGEVHRARFVDPLLAGLPLLGTLSGLSLPVGGSATTIDAQGSAPGGFTSVHGASFRGAYDLSDLERSRFVIATGESGQAFSPHLADFASDWRRIRTIALARAPDRVTGRLVLLPAGAPSAD